MKKYKIPEKTSIGHIHLKVSNIEKSLGFYCGVLGFEKIIQYGDEAAFVSAGGYHHHIGLNTWTSKGMGSASEKGVGLYHVAILYPTRKDLAIIVDRLLKKNVEIEGAADHGVSQAIYLSDPDGNGIELYWDRPRDRGPKDENGNITMYTKYLDIDDLLSLLD